MTKKIKEINLTGFFCNEKSIGFIETPICSPVVGKTFPKKKLPIPYVA
jgi:hypothetical protein